MTVACTKLDIETYMLGLQLVGWASPTSAVTADVSPVGDPTLHYYICTGATIICRKT